MDDPGAGGAARTRPADPPGVDEDAEPDVRFDVLEAIITTAASHPPACACQVCRAASGDMDAMADVMAEVVWARAQSDAKPAALDGGS